MLFLGRILLIFLLLFCIKAEEKPHEIETIATVSIKSSINPATFNYLRSSFQKAEQEGIDLIVIKLNTPGGLVSTTKDILTLMGEVKIPHVVWVTPTGASATSAGAIIASAAHFLFMGEGTNIGAATPVSLGGDQSGDHHAKAINDLAALVEGLSEAHGRNPKPFREMIEKAASFTSVEAKKKNLINGLANRKEELLSQLEGQSTTLQGERIALVLKGPTWIDYPMDAGLRILNIFANPTTAYLLFLLGAALLYLELQAPGGLIAGALGALSLIMSAIGFQVLPLNLGALGLIVLSFILFGMELVITSYGILSLGGLAALMAGGLFLFRTDDAYLQFSETLVYGTALAIGAFLLFLAVFWIRDRKTTTKTFNSLVGLKAVVIEEIPSPEEGLFFYQVKVGGEIWRGKASRPLKAGDFVEVGAQRANTLDLV